MPSKSSTAADSTFPASRGPAFLQSRLVTDQVPFGTAEQMVQFHQAISRQEGQLGRSLLTDEQHQDMTWITARMGNVLNPPDANERRVLLQDFGALVRTASQGGFRVESS